ncbi:hypothetical protein ACQ4M4_08435 [Leptolyngbya sp. AN02str]|uniref:hypothetical protein n=1 Tax=Leptolyngbya sp. AN02str TaxID=3423363 RepID=UPI003D31BC9E
MSDTETFERSAPSEAWYIVKQSTGVCDIVDASDLAANSENTNSENPDAEQWGPFPSQGEAIARRVGLIRAGKCKPV